jgi:hypothetical protein
MLTTCVNQLDPADHEQLWTWNGAEWALIFDDGPPPLVVTSAAWDSWNEVLVRYGGLPLESNECAAETWEWVGVEWHAMPRTTDQHPTACDHMKLAYDESTRMTVLFGGGQLQDLSPQTWGWDGEKWSQLASAGGPAPRAHHGLVYELRQQRVLLYGGIDNTSIFDDLWRWDGAAWTHVDGPSGPGSRSHFGFAASPDAVMLFGGATDNSTFATLTDETWTFTERGWTQLAIPGPSPRGSPALAYDPGRGVWVLYGGFDATGAELGDTWEFDGSTWTCVDQCDATS